MLSCSQETHYFVTHTPPNYLLNSGAKKKADKKRKATLPDPEAVARARMRATLRGGRNLTAAVVDLTGYKKKKALLGFKKTQDDLKSIEDAAQAAIAASKTQGRGGAWEADVIAMLRRDKGRGMANFGSLRAAIQRKGDQARMAKKDGDVIRAGRLGMQKGLLEDRWLELIASIETLYPEFKDVATRNAQKSGIGLIVKQYYTYIQRQYAVQAHVSRERRKAAGRKILGPPV